MELSKEIKCPKCGFCIQVEVCYHDYRPNLLHSATLFIEGKSTKVYQEIIKFIKCGHQKDVK